jgi:hypothetical protein
MRKGTREKEKYYNVYHKDSTASCGVVISVNKSSLACLTKGISLQKIVDECGLYLEDKILKSKKDYTVTEISTRKAERKIEDSKYRFSFQNLNDSYF